MGMQTASVAFHVVSVETVMRKKKVISINQATIDCTEDSVICDLATAQDENNDIGLVKSWVKSIKRPTTQAVSSESWFVKSLTNQFD